MDVAVYIKSSSKTPNSDVTITAANTFEFFLSFDILSTESGAGVCGEMCTD